jgi:hypothetical protein
VAAPPLQCRQSPAKPPVSTRILWHNEQHPPSRADWQTKRRGVPGSQGVHRPTTASRDLRCCMAASHGCCSCAHLRRAPNSAAIALCSSVACLPHRCDGLPGLGGRYRFGTPWPSACRDAWGRLHHARIGRSRLFAIALLYSVGLRNPSMVWTADLDREKGSLAHMFRNAKRDSTTGSGFERPLRRPVPLRCDDPAAGYLPVPVPVPVPVPLLQFWTCRSSYRGRYAPGDLPLLRFPGWLSLQ